MDDIAAWLDQQMENQRHTGDALKALAAALPPETGAYLVEVGDFLIEDASAKRRILDLYADAVRMHGLMEETDNDGKWDWLFRSEALEGVVQLLALPHAGRPDYRDEWRP